MLAIINFKAYENSSGFNAIRLAKICEKVAKKKKANIAVAVQPADIFAVASNVSIPVIAQHVDAIRYGANTGWILPESVVMAGAVGSLVNHSEHPIPLPQIKETIRRLRELGMVSVACAGTPSMAVKIADFYPDAIAIEPPELIGGNISVSKARPQVIANTTSRIRDVPILCGAGIRTTEDVKRAVELGVRGILVSSGVANAKSPGTALAQLVKGLM
ncbi:MAG: triose-phosphate isomerase [Candidatus Woesearchaeota archaeon]